MAVYQLARYDIRPDAQLDAERAMHEYASYVRAELPDASFTAYRDPAAPSHFIALTRSAHATAEDQRRAATGTRAFDAALAALLERPVEVREYVLVTSSDLAPRHRPREKSRRPR